MKRRPGRALWAVGSPVFVVLIIVSAMVPTLAILLGVVASLIAIGLGAAISDRRILSAPARSGRRRRTATRKRAHARI